MVDMIEILHVEDQVLFWEEFQLSTGPNGAQV